MRGVRVEFTDGKVEHIKCDAPLKLTPNGTLILENVNGNQTVTIAIVGAGVLRTARPMTKEEADREFGLPSRILHG